MKFGGDIDLEKPLADNSQLIIIFILHIIYLQILQRDPWCYSCI